MSKSRRPAVPGTRCRWCAQPAGVVPLCSAACFRLAAWAGWFDPARLWARQNSKLVAKTETVTNMADKDFPNSGILFRNDRKREGGHDPDYKGTCDIQCQCGRRFTRKIGGWIKQGRNGKFLTLSLKPRPEGDGAQTTADDDARF
jgi:hypothetical protein